MKKEKKLFQLPTLTTMEGKKLSVNDLSDIEDGFKTCNDGCDDGCSSGVGTGTKARPGIFDKCETCTE